MEQVGTMMQRYGGKEKFENFHTVSFVGGILIVDKF